MVKIKCMICGKERDVGDTVIWSDGICDDCKFKMFRREMEVKP